MPLTGGQLSSAEGAAPFKLLTQRFSFSFCKIHIFPCFFPEYVLHLLDACYVISAGMNSAGLTHSQRVGPHRLLSVIFAYVA